MNENCENQYVAEKACDRPTWWPSFSVATTMSEQKMKAASLLSLQDLSLQSLVLEVLLAYLIHCQMSLFKAKSSGSFMKKVHQNHQVSAK